MWLAKCKQLPAKLRGSYNLSELDTISAGQSPGLMSPLIAILMRIPGHSDLHVLFTNRQDRILDNFLWIIILKWMSSGIQLKTIWKNYSVI